MKTPTVSTNHITPTTGAISKIIQPVNSEKNAQIQVGMDRYVTVLKRLRSPNSSKVVPSAKVSKDNKPNNENRFSILECESDEVAIKVNSTKPPPIYLRENNSNSLVQSLIKLIGENSFYILPIKKGAIHEIKLQVNSENDYRKVVADFEAHKKNFYTYQLKCSKGLQVVVKGIDSNVDPSEIKQSLEEKGFKTKNVINIRNREKTPQPLFRVELEPGNMNLKKGEVHPIYNLKYLLHRKITVEEPHKRSGPIQCMNCQEYGHTKAYCKLPSVCVICGELHNTSQCNKPKDDSKIKKCSNCGGNHTANYRGCPVYSIVKKSLSQKPIFPAQNRATYANVLENKRAQPQCPAPRNPQLQQPYDNRGTYANVLKNNQSQPQGPEPQTNFNKNPKVKDQVPEFNFSRLESTIEALVQTVNNFTNSMSNMMQEMLKMQSMLLQAVLNRP